MFTVTAPNYHNPNEEQHIILSINIPGSIEQHTDVITQIITNIFEQYANKLQSLTQSRIVSTIKVKRKIEKKIIDALIELGIEENKSNQFGIWGKIYEKKGRAYMEQEWIVNGCGWPYLCD